MDRFLQIYKGERTIWIFSFFKIHLIRDEKYPLQTPCWVPVTTSTITASSTSSTSLANKKDKVFKKTCQLEASRRRQTFKRRRYNTPSERVKEWERERERRVTLGCHQQHQRMVLLRRRCCVIITHSVFLSIFCRHFFVVVGWLVRLG